MLPSIGVDLLHLPRLSTLLSRRSTYLHRFARRILTPTELHTFHQKLSTTTTTTTTTTTATTPWDHEKGPIRWLAVRWAAKEAAFKATGGNLGWKQVQVGYHSSGKPYLEVVSGAQMRVGGLSISHDGEYVVAMAVLPA